jgi:hypothetical protein
VQNSSVKTFNVTVISPFGYLRDFVLLGTEWVNIGPGVTVMSGNVGAFDASAGIPSSNGFELRAGPAAHFQGGSQLAAQSVKLSNSTLAGDVFYVDKIDVSAGVVYTPKTGYVPLFFGMPVVPSFSPGGANVTLSGTQTLGPGSYGAVSVSPNANVTLTGGAYAITSLDVKPGATVHFGAPTNLDVGNRVQVRNGAKLLPGLGVNARDVVLVATGIDGPPSNPAFAIQIGSGADVRVDAYAPNGTLSFGSFASGTGAFIGRRVDVSSNATIEHDSSFLSP